MYTITKELAYSIVYSGSETYIDKVITKKKNIDRKSIFKCGVAVVKEYPIFHEITKKGQKIPVVDAVVLKIKPKIGETYFVFVGKEGKPYIRKSSASIVSLAECKGKYKKMFLEKLA